MGRYQRMAFTGQTAEGEQWTLWLAFGRNGSMWCVCRGDWHENGLDGRFKTLHEGGEFIRACYEPDFFEPEEYEELVETYSFSGDVWEFDEVKKAVIEGLPIFDVIN